MKDVWGDIMLKIGIFLAIGMGVIYIGVQVDRVFFSTSGTYIVQEVVTGSEAKLRINEEMQSGRWRNYAEVPEDKIHNLDDLVTWFYQNVQPIRNYRGLEFTKVRVTGDPTIKYIVHGVRD